MKYYSMAAPRRLFMTLSDDRNLRRFVVQARSTGKQLGIGSYGAVEEVEVNGLLCAGKKIHEILLDVDNMGVRDIAVKYVQECQLMSDLRHPNITLFLGLCFLPNCQFPVLVMERLEGSLDDLLETVPKIPWSLKYSILEDVAQGLLYLHKHDPQIIHRDLTARNVLLTSGFVAKITDLGNSRIVNIQPGQLAQTFSRNPGTLVYMPPEALSGAARYGPSLDVFSFGHLGIFVGLQLFPGDLLEPTYADSENRGQLLARSEVKRRWRYIEQLDYQLPKSGQHPFVQLVKRCLQNDPSERPTAEQLVLSLGEMKADTEGPCGEVTRAEAVRHVVTMRAILRKEREMRRKDVDSVAKDEEIQHLQLELEHEQAERIRAEGQLHQQTTELQMQLQQKDVQIQEKEAELEQERALIQQKENELINVRLILQRLQIDVEDKKAQLRVLEKEVEQRDAEIVRLMGEIHVTNGQAQILKQQENCTCTLTEGESTHQMKSTPTPLVELKGPLKLKWRRMQDMPFTVTGHAQAVVIDSDVYVGGGAGTVVMVYSLHTRMWRTLPPYESEWFSMAVVNNQLVLVGGRRVISTKNIMINALGVWNVGLQTWTYPFPAMHTPRRSPSTISYNKWLVVAGGIGNASHNEAVIELLDTLSKQWYRYSPLPSAYSRMSSAVNGNMWYLFSPDHTSIFTICLDNLISHALLSSDKPSMQSQWQTLPLPPTAQSTVLVHNSALYAVGGLNIQHYQPSISGWIEIADLPCDRSRCACVVLPSGEIFLAGGEARGGLGIKRVDIATIMF